MLSARAMLTVPRALDADLLREQRMSASEYSALMHLSEAPGRRLRMSDLAGASNLSLSGMTRIVDRLQGQGFVRRERTAATAAAGTLCSPTRGCSGCARPGRPIWPASEGMSSTTSTTSTYPHSPRPYSASPPTPSDRGRRAPEVRHQDKTQRKHSPSSP